MSLFTIIILIVLGIFLFLVEFLLVPGVTIAGIAGFVLFTGGIYFGYDSFGTPLGHYILAGAIVLSFITFYFSFRGRTWKRLTLDSRIEGKVSSYQQDKVHQGDTGKTITRLNPMGKILVNGEIFEAKSNGQYVEENKKIKIIKMSNYSVIVEPIE